MVSCAQQSDSAIHIHVSILPQTPLPSPSRLPHNIEQSSLCYRVGTCWLSILNTAVCTCQSQISHIYSQPGEEDTTHWTGSHRGRLQEQSRQPGLWASFVVSRRWGVPGPMGGWDWLGWIIPQTSRELKPPTQGLHLQAVHLVSWVKRIVWLGTLSMQAEWL